MEKNQERWNTFCEIYSKELVPYFNAYEVQRRKMVSAIILCYIIFLGFLLPLSIVILIICNYTIGNCIGICFLGLFVINIFAINQKQKFKKLLKKNCIGKILRAFSNIRYRSYVCSFTENIDIEQEARKYNSFENIEKVQKTNNPVANIGDTDIEGSRLFKTYNIRTDDDLFNGNYNGVDYKILETFLEHKSSTGKKQSRNTVFKGVIALFSSNKNFSGRTIIVTKGNSDSIGTIVALWLLLLMAPPFLIFGTRYISDNPQNIFAWFYILIPIFCFFMILREIEQEKLVKVELEDPILRKHFNVYSTNQVEARYLLTTAFIERFKNLKTAFGTKKIKCSFFFRNKIMFAISSKDLFEIGHLYKSLHDPKNIYKLYSGRIPKRTTD